MLSIRSDRALAAAYLVFAVGAMLSLALLMHHGFARNAPRRFAAPPFVWPAGCPATAYDRSAELQRACFDPRNRLRSPLRLGLIGGTRGDRWFRVGDDAVAADCAWPGTPGFCRVDAIMPGKFRR